MPGSVEGGIILDCREPRGQSHQIGGDAAVTPNDEGGGKGIAERNASALQVVPSLKWTVRCVDDWNVLESIRNEWDELAANALEPSPSSESWMLLPALRYLAAGAVVKVLLMYVHHRESPDRVSELCCVFPLEVVPAYKGLPIKVLRHWNHGYCLLSAPLLRAKFAAECVREFFRWVREEWPGSTLVELPLLPSDSQFFRVVADVLREDELMSHVIDVHMRAFFRPRRTAEDYLNAIGTAHHRHEMRRQERKLRELGNLRYERLSLDADVVAWVDEFVTLEMEGWKGKEGTAFGSKEDHRAYLMAVVRAAAQRGRLMLLGLRLNGRAIALKLNFIGGNGGYTFKIAFDEGYAKYSPGTLLELESIRQAHADSNITWLDSLALPGHTLMNRVWLDRTAVLSQLIAPGRPLGEFWLASLPLLGLFKRRVLSGRRRNQVDGQ